MNNRMTVRAERTKSRFQFLNYPNVCPVFALSAFRFAQDLPTRREHMRREVKDCFVSFMRFLRDNPTLHRLSILGRVQNPSDFFRARD
jgi:hypothetical protein